MSKLYIAEMYEQKIAVLEKKLEVMKEALFLISKEASWCEEMNTSTKYALVVDRARDALAACEALDPKETPFYES